MMIVRKLTGRQGRIATGLRELWGYIHKEGKGDCACADGAQQQKDTVEEAWLLHGKRQRETMSEGPHTTKH